MKLFQLSTCAAALVMLGACGHGTNQVADTGLATDLSLAAQQKAFTPNDSLLTNQAAGTVAETNAPASTSRSATVHHSSATTHHASSGSSSGSSSSGTYSAPAPARTTVVKHTKRDAAIGAAAGAVIGATTSHNKVKGGIIGAAVGGILGGVIGNNVDKTKKGGGGGE
jgi:hypothetical protein